MELYAIIDQLVEERDRIDQIIKHLEGMDGFMPTKKTAAGSKYPGKKRGRKSMDAAARREVSERMSRYWAAKRAEREKAPLGPVRVMTAAAGSGGTFFSAHAAMAAAGLGLTQV